MNATTIFSMDIEAVKFERQSIRFCSTFYGFFSQISWKVIW